MSSPDDRIAELESKVATLEQQMDALAQIVGGLGEALAEVTGNEWDRLPLSSGLVWKIVDHDDAGPGEEPEPLGVWLLPEEVASHA